jgi:hypothetical protein
VEKISGRIEVDVPGSYCDPADLPSEEDDCRLFCPEECVLSEWTEWSSCLSVITLIIIFLLLQPPKGSGFALETITLDKNDSEL